MKVDRTDVLPENTKQTEWIEIVEPKSKQRMFANLVTGECAWEPPPNVYVKKTEGNQWWELYDSNNTCRYYYYNPTTTETVWQRPFNCDIIPLAKLQLLKENTECAISAAKYHSAAARNSSCPHCVSQPDHYYHHQRQNCNNSQNLEVEYSRFCADVGAALPGLTVFGHNKSSSTPADHHLLNLPHQCRSFAEPHNSSVSSSAAAMAAFNDSFSENGGGAPDELIAAGSCGTSRNRDKQRNPSASFTYRRAQTSRSRPNPKESHSLQNAFTVSELPAQIAAAHRNWAFAKGFRSYSPSSSVSSFGNHSADLLSTESTIPTDVNESGRGSADGTASYRENLQPQPPTMASASSLAASAAAVGRRRCELRDASVSSASSIAVPRTPHIANNPSSGQQPDAISNNASIGGVITSSLDGSTAAAGTESWTKNSLKAPLNAELSDKKLRKHAMTLFKQIQSYMGDRKSKLSADQIALAVVECCTNASADANGDGVAAFIDEVFLQLLKQLIDNPRVDSVRRGWELLGIFLFFFGPSSRVFRQVLNFVEFYSDPILDTPELGASKYAKHCMKRLQMLKPPTGNGYISNVAITPARPSTTEAIRQARYNIFYPSKFGTTLEELMEMQASQFPHLKIPWIQATLIRMILDSGGEKTEGLFRIASDPEQLNTALMQLEVWVKPVVKDAHVPAALLKQWLRQLPSPLIPADMYEACLMATTSSSPSKMVADACCRLIGALPDINRIVLAALAQLLQRLCRNPETVRQTKMDVANLAMVMAPNVLRCESADPAVIFANSRREMEFMKAVILHYDTSAYMAAS